jgi:hypothetical protein
LAALIPKCPTWAVANPDDISAVFVAVYTDSGGLSGSDQVALQEGGG